MFSKFKYCNDKRIENILRQAIDANGRIEGNVGKIIGGYYFIYKNRLTFAFDVYAPSSENALSYVPFKVLKGISIKVPEEYGEKIDFWELDRFRTEVPKRIQENTGHIGIYHH